MARDWRRVALAVIAAAALAGLSASSLDAQSAKRSAKAAPPKQATASRADNDADDKTPAKRRKQDPVEAQRVIDAAGKLVQAGEADQAIQSLSATLSAGNLPPPIMAKALYTRGVAYRQKSQPAQALSDLTSALWLKGGLNEADRADALKQRSGAYADAGLTERGEEVAASVPAAKERPSSPAKGWSTETSAPAPSSSSGGWLENLFGASAAPTKAAPPTETASIQKADPASAPATRVRISKAWSNATEVHADRAAPSPAAAAPRTAARVSDPSPALKAAAGKYRVQLATVRSQAEARALAAKAKQQHASALAAREPEIDQTVLGNMGAFYRVRVGPYATLQETQAVCARLKGSGFDCMSVTQ
jgi:hypothetical protein